MDFAIENFSTYFCMVFSAPVTIPLEFNLERFQIGVEPETLSEVISSLHEIFQVEFKAVIERLIETKTSDFQPFMEAVISKCVKISEKKTTYVHFMLVCTLINGIISDWFENKECFLIPKLCSCCLVSVYERCYKSYFYSKEEGNTLDFHVKSLKKLLNTQKRLTKKRNLAIFRENNASTVIKSLVDFDAVDYALNDYEQKTLKDILSSLPIESSSSEVSCYRFINTEESMEYVTLPENFLQSTSESSSSESSCYGYNKTEDAMEYAIMAENVSESTSLPCEPESSSYSDIKTEDAMEYVLMPEDSSESASMKSESESSSCRDIKTGDAMECVLMPQDSSESTNISSESESSCRDNKTEDAAVYVTTHEDSSELTRKLPEQSHCREDIMVDNSKKLPPLKKYYCDYKNRICTVCAGRCATFMVSYVENILEKYRQ